LGVQAIEDARAAVSEIQLKQEGKHNELRSTISALEASPDKDQRRISELSSVLDQEALKLKKIREAADHLSNNSDFTLDSLLKEFGDYIAEALDREKGKEVTDQSIFRAHASKYEVRLQFDPAYFTQKA